MNIQGNSLLAQMQSMATEAGSTKINSIPSVNNSSQDFGNLLKNAINTVNDLQHDAGVKKTAFEMGDRSISLAETMISASKAGLAFSATVQVRNKFVEAYKEIMSMPV
ncbi:MAG: flagellar hook-basal body complex protein FliE [Gammaproteobacteria bacterium]|nr:MAG: flagellar hook-basal body complex protein FliE [Gammaproteobacteria bacterium]